MIEIKVLLTLNDAATVIHELNKRIAELEQQLKLTYLTLREYQDDPVLLGARLRIQRTLG